MTLTLILWVVCLPLVFGAGVWYGRYSLFPIEWLAADKFPERTGLRHAALQAIQDIDQFLAIASPNNAQVLAAVRELARQNKRIIQRLIQID